MKKQKMTKCECGCGNNVNCIYAVYYLQEHNGYDLLNESRLYYAKIANDANEELEKTRVLRNELHNQMLKLLVKVMDLDVRKEFDDQVLAAWTARDKNEILKVINAMHLYLEPPSTKQSGFAYFYRYNYPEIDKKVKARNPERQARDVTNELFLLWNSLTKEEQKEWTDSAPDEI
jgi:hypothetical protein